VADVECGKAVTSDVWQRVQDVFDRVSAAAPSDRAAVLDEACGDDAALRAEVESLLEHDTRAGDDFLASPAVAFRPADHTPPAVALPPADGGPPAWALALVGRKIGRYTVVRLLGQGGMGCVFEARQDQPARAVALKVLQPGFSAPSALARFRLEPEVLGRLQHPNIAQVFEAGVHRFDQNRDREGADLSDGTTGSLAGARGSEPSRDREGAEPLADARGSDSLPYFAMEFIPDAQALIEYADVHELTTRQRLELFAKVCDAVQHGHQKGIIHRDLKPGNILVGQDGEPKVIDFGVARASDADIVMTTQCTHVGDLVGTVHYMSPEQCDGDPAGIDTRSDIYSLGVVLYELLTGLPPYDTAGTTVYGALRVIKDEPPRQPSTVVGRDGRPERDRRPGKGGRPGKDGRPGGDRRPGWDGRLAGWRGRLAGWRGRLARELRGDIDAILLKALEKDPARRYASAADLAQDIRRHLAGEPIEARPPTLWTRTGRWITRHPVLATTGACLGIAALVFAGTFISLQIINARPYEIVVMKQPGLESSHRGYEARLLARSGRILQTWPSQHADGIEFANLLNWPPGPHGGHLAVVAVAGDHEQPGSVRAYDVDRSLEVAKWELRVKPGDPLPDPHGRGYRAETFGLSFAKLLDVFEDDCGPEIIVNYKSPASQSIVRIHNLRGELLYEFWSDGEVSSCHWLAEAGVLVFGGDDGYATYLERRYVQRGGHSPQPQVVFALRPERGKPYYGFVQKEWRDDPDRAEWAGPEPLWYLCLAPADVVNGPMVSFRAHVGAPQFTGPHGRRFSVSASTGADGGGVGVTWDADEFGNEIPGTRYAVDSYKDNLRLADGDPGKLPLPDPSVFRLEPLQAVGHDP
jgi:serine/threonine protein kinase